MAKLDICARGDYEHICDPLNNGYTLPMIHTHGINDDVIPIEQHKWP